MVGLLIYIQTTYNRIPFTQNPENKPECEPCTEGPVAVRARKLENVPCPPRAGREPCCGSLASGARASYPLHSSVVLDIGCEVS